MKHRVPRKGVMLALVVLLLLAIHVVVPHAVVSVPGWWRRWPVIAGIALVLAVKAVIIAHVRKSRRAKATSPEILDQRIVLPGRKLSARPPALARRLPVRVE